MRLSARCASAALILIAPLAAAQGAAADGPSGRAVAAPLHRTAAAVPGEYIVTVDKGLDPARVAARVGGVEPLHTYRHVLNGFSARLDAAQLEQVRALPGVEAVEENGRAGDPGGQRLARPGHPGSRLQLGSRPHRPAGMGQGRGRR